MALKSKLTEFIHQLIPYDYALFGGVFVLFILFIVFGILARKKVFLAVVFILLAFGVLLLGPTIGYVKMHEYLFKNSVTLLSQKRLNFTPALVLKATVVNQSKKKFSQCKVNVNVYKVTSNKLKNYLKKLKPFLKRSIVLEDIQVQERREFKMIIEPFTYSREYNISLGADCR